MTFGTAVRRGDLGVNPDTAFDAGITFLDTADVYPSAAGSTLPAAPRRSSAGGSKGKRGGRRDVDQVRRPGRAQPLGPGPSRKHVLDAITARCVGSAPTTSTSTAPLVRPFDTLDETLDALDTFVRRARAATSACRTGSPTRSPAPSAGPRQTGSYASTRRSRATTLLFASPSASMLPLLRRGNIAVIPYNPLAGGLVGKHGGAAARPRRGPLHRRPGRRHVQERYLARREFETIRGAAPAGCRSRHLDVTLAVAWVLANPAINGAHHRRQQARAARRQRPPPSTSPRRHAAEGARRPHPRVSHGDAADSCSAVDHAHRHLPVPDCEELDWRARGKCSPPGATPSRARSRGRDGPPAKPGRSPAQKA